MANIDYAGLSDLRREVAQYGQAPTPNINDHRPVSKITEKLSALEKEIIISRELVGKLYTRLEPIIQVHTGREPEEPKEPEYGSALAMQIQHLTKELRDIRQGVEAILEGLDI